MERIRRPALLFLILILLLPLLGAGRASAAGGPGTVVGYYAAWASAQGYTPDKLPAERFTQINYAFAAIEGGEAVLSVPERDKENLKALTALRRRNADLKIVLSIGGWDESAYFSDAASTAARREAFAQSCLNLVLSHDLDGIDLDWEYPVQGGAPGVIHRPQDRENFTLLLQTIRKTLDRQGRRDGRRYVLSIAGAASAGYLKCIEPEAVAETVDHIFLMAYDLHGPWDLRTNFNAPLRAEASSQSSVDAAVSAWLDHQVPPEKLVLGMPLYGYIYQGAIAANDGLYSRFTAAKSVPWSRVKSDYLSRPTYRHYRHETAEVPYLYGNGSFLSYDDPASIAAKADLARSRDLGGIGFWELSQDPAGELIESACTAWSGQRFQDVPTDAWYAGAVERVSASGLMQGSGPAMFSPGAPVTRGQIAAILYRQADSPSVYGSSFSDVSPSAYYSRAIAWAARRGIVEGYSDGTFRPDQPVSRQQLAAILHRYAKLNRIDSGKRTPLEGFGDAASVSTYARESLSWALAEGILQGTKQGDLQPHGKAARGQTAVLLDRFCQLLG